MPKVSIIIRTKNEERWIRHCLIGLAQQNFKDYEIILVDNESTDYTVGVARRYPVAKIISIANFLPGNALNEGIRQSTGEYIACLSAHCIPAHANWLSALLANFEQDNIAGVYGRQLPVAFTDDLDKRDLITVFGLDRRVQVKDYFFHNANSMLHRNVWERFPFDEGVTNIEDRVWGKSVIQAGYRLIYEPEAAVYHYHGIHQNNNLCRARGVVSIIEKIDPSTVHGFPDSMRPDQCHVAAIAPLRGDPPVLAGVNLLERLLGELKKSRFVKSTYLFSSSAEAATLAQKMDVAVIHRPPDMNATDKTAEDVLHYCLKELEKANIFPDSLLFADCLYPFRPVGLFDELVQNATYNGLDTLFPAYVDFNNTWRKLDDGTFAEIGNGFLSRKLKDPMYRAIYGLGCLTSTSVVRQGRMVGGKIGIHPITGVVASLRNVQPDLKIIIETLLNHGPYST